MTYTWWDLGLFFLLYSFLGWAAEAGVLRRCQAPIL